MSTRIIIAILSLVWTTVSSGQTPFPTTNFYQIHVRSFYDSDGDGLGDLRGIEQKLDYLDDLGIGALWIMPVFVAHTPHKYFSEDFMRIDPEYGTNKDMKRLVKAAHRRDMKVMIDFSINHADRQHPWFLQAEESRVNGEPASYKNRQTFFHFVKDREDFNPECFTKTHQLDRSFLKNYEPITIRSGSDSSFYYARFLDAPDFNYDNQAVRAYFLEVGRYWVGKIGVDGLRLDAARHIYDIESPGPISASSRNYDWWNLFCSEMHKMNPSVFLLGEIWSDEKTMGSYLTTGMDATFNFTFSTALLNAVTSGTGNSLVKQYQAQMNHYSQYADEFGDATFLINHDMKRLQNELGFDEQKVRLAVAMLLTMPGSPFIYYGEELGYEADWPLLWLPMLWDEPGLDPGQCSWILGDVTIRNDILTTQYSRDSLSHFRPLSQQSLDQNSLYHHYRSLMRFRREHAVISRGKMETTNIEDEEIVSFFRTLGNHRVLVLHNLSADDKTLSQASLGVEIVKSLYPPQSITMSTEVLKVPAFGSVVAITE